MSVAKTKPAVSASTLTPSDSAVLDSSRGIWVGGAGNLTVRFEEDDSDVVIVGVLAGTLLPFAVSMVKSTGTTATSLILLK